MTEKRRCAYCGRVEVDVHGIQRYGGGNWRRAGRWYSSSISVECARSLLASGSNAGFYALQTISRYLVRDLQKIVGEESA